MNSNNFLIKQKNKKIKKNKRAKMYIYMKIEFQNSIVRLSFLCRITDIKIAWISL